LSSSDEAEVFGDGRLEPICGDDSYFDSRPEQCGQCLHCPVSFDATLRLVAPLRPYAWSPTSPALSSRARDKQPGLTTTDPLPTGKRPLVRAKSYVALWRSFQFPLAILRTLAVEPSDRLNCFDSAFILSAPGFRLPSSPILYVVLALISAAGPTPLFEEHRARSESP
jgi:hypothetical protein